MRKLTTSIMKEILILIRDLAGLLIIFLMPMVLVFVMALIQDSTFRKMDETRLSVLFIDEDGDLVGPAIRAGLDSSDMISLHTEYEGLQLDRQKLVELVSEGKYQIGIIIPPDASEKLRLKAAALVEKAFEDEDHPAIIPGFEAAGVVLYFDPVIKQSFRETARMALARLTYAIEARMVFDLFSQKVSEITESEAVIEYDPSGIIKLVEYDAINRHTEVIPNSVQHNVPAWAVFAMFFILIPLTGNIIRERTSGSMLRIRLMPGSYMFTILAKIIVYLFISIVQFILMLLVGLLILPMFGLPLLDLGDHLFALFIMIIASGLAATGFGLALGAIFSMHEQAAAFGSVAIIILAALGGIWVPVFMMPKIMQDIAILSPLNWALEGFYTIFLRNGSCADIMPWVIPLVLFSMVCMMVAFYFLRLKKN